MRIEENKRLIDAAARSTAYEEKDIEEDTAKLALSFCESKI